MRWPATLMWQSKTVISGLCNEYILFHVTKKNNNATPMRLIQRQGFIYLFIYPWIPKWLRGQINFDLVFEFLNRSCSSPFVPCFHFLGVTSILRYFYPCSFKSIVSSFLCYACLDLFPVGNNTLIFSVQRQTLDLACLLNLWREPITEHDKGNSTDSI